MKGAEIDLQPAMITYQENYIQAIFVRRTRTNCQIGQQINIQTDNCRQTNKQTNRQKYEQQKSRQRLQHNNNQTQGGDISGKYRSNIREIYYEDIENLEPYEVLEFMGITDYEKYLDKNFTIPFIKTWTR